MNINPVQIFKANKVNFNYFSKAPIAFRGNNKIGDSFEKQEDNCAYPLTKKYGLNVADIEVKSANPISISDKQKATFVEKLLEAHELAKKNVETGNIVQLGFASNLCLSDNTWHLATNFNNTRNDISSICGERSAIVVAYNDFLKKLIKDNDTETTQDDFKIKYLAMSSAKNIGEDSNASLPCADCLSWLNTARFLDDETKIAFFTKDSNSGKLFLEFKTLKEILPMRGIDLIDSKADIELDDMPFVFSDDAKRVMDEKGITNENILNTLKEAKNAYNADEFTSFSDQKIGAAIRTEGRYYKASKVDWSKRWFVEPVEFAIAKSIEDFNEYVTPEIIAYYGENETRCEGAMVDDGIVSLRTLGRIKAVDKNNEALVITINNNDEIDVRSNKDFMPKKSTFKQSYLK